MKLPRNVSGTALVRGLTRVGYAQVRQEGSHVRMTGRVDGNEHHITVPMHTPIKVGTLHGILKDVSSRIGLELPELLRQMKI